MPRPLHALLCLALAVALQTGCASSPSAGPRAPAFSAIDSNGEVVSLAAFRDEVVILDFWAVW